MNFRGVKKRFFELITYLLVGNKCEKIVIMKIKLTENKLKQIVVESVKKVLYEKNNSLYNFNPEYNYSSHVEDYDDYYEALRKKRKNIKERKKHTLEDLEGQTVIPQNYFLGNKKLSEVVIPEGIIEIGQNAFGHCINLKSVILPSTLKTIGSQAFQGCTSLTNITIPESVKTIGSFAFFNSGLVSIPETQAVLGRNVFKGCNIQFSNEISENIIKNIIKNSLTNVLNENNFKTPLHKKRAAIAARGRKRGKTSEEIKQDVLDDMAKRQAIMDINKYRSVSTMPNHERRFNNTINDDTFRTEFDDVRFYDSYYDDYTKNNKPVEGGFDPTDFLFGNNDYED